jgi:hypothetical protein
MQSATGELQSLALCAPALIETRQGRSFNLHVVTPAACGVEYESAAQVEPPKEKSALESMSVTLSTIVQPPPAVFMSQYVRKIVPPMIIG